RDLDRLASAKRRASHADGDAAMLSVRAAAGVDRVEHHVREGAGQRVVMARDHRQVVGDVYLYVDLRRNRGARRIANQLADVDLGARTFWEAPELREASRHVLQSLRFDR